MGAAPSKELGGSAVTEVDVVSKAVGGENVRVVLNDGVTEDGTSKGEQIPLAALQYGASDGQQPAAVLFLLQAGSEKLMQAAI